MSKITSSLKFKNYIVEKVEFNVNYNFSGEDKEIYFDLDDDCKFEDNNFILTLDMVIFPEADKNDYPFTMKVRLVGLFEVDESVNEETKMDFAQKNSIAILFPYLRALTSVYTSNSNVGTLILPPINVVKYLRNKKLKVRNKK